MSTIKSLKNIIPYLERYSQKFMEILAMPWDQVSKKGQTLEKCNLNVQQIKHKIYLINTYFTYTEYYLGF